MTMLNKHHTHKLIHPQAVWIDKPHEDIAGGKMT